MTAGDGRQFRLLLEQRSTGYSWCTSSQITSNNNSISKRIDDVDTSCRRSRLSGLKQLSAAGLANLRQKINEGRKMLDRRLSASQTLEGFQEEPISHVSVLDVSTKVGDTRLSACDDFLIGVFPETSILTFHNCDLDVLPQPAFRLPKNVVKGRNKRQLPSFHFGTFQGKHEDSV